MGRGAVLSSALGNFLPSVGSANFMYFMLHVVALLGKVDYEGQLERAYCHATAGRFV